jgi:PAS domain S-box-containing protein
VAYNRPLLLNRGIKVFCSMKNTKSDNIHAEQMTAEVARLQQVERELNTRLRQQAAIARIGQQTLEMSDLEEVMREVVQLLTQTLEVEFCKILEIAPGGNELLLKAGTGWHEGLIGKVTVSAGTGSQAGITLLLNDPVIVEDLSSENRFHGSKLLIEHGVVSGMSVVIPGIEKPYGVLGVHTRQLRRFNQDDANFLRSVSHVLASAILRYRTETELNSSRDQLAIILQEVSNGVTVQDTSGELVYANQVAAKMFGYPSKQAILKAPVAEIIGKYEILDDRGRPFPLEQLPGRRVLAGEERANAMVRLRIVATGEERWLHIKSSAVPGSTGKANLAINIFQDITHLRNLEQSQRLISEADSVLTASLDYYTTLQSIAQLTVSHLSDWCVVHLVEDDEIPLQIAVAHVEPQKVALAEKIQECYPPDLKAETGVANVLRTGLAEFYPEIPESFLEKAARDTDHFKMLKQLGLKSAILMPLNARGRTIGAITMVWAESGRRYSPHDIVLAQELASRAAFAIDNARLYQKAQSLNADLENRVNTRTSQLQALVTKLRTEISERKRVEKALRKQELVLQGLFESAPDATLLVDSDGKIVRLNARAEEMFGYDRVELMGSSIDNLLPQRYRESHLLDRETYTQDPRTRPMGAGIQLFARRKNGEEFPVDIMLSPVQTEQGPMVIAAVRDITERKQMEAELAELQVRLIESLEAERLHLAQELHDGPIQDLYAISFQLRSIEDTIHQAFENGHQVETNIVKKIQAVVDLLRAICGDLRPPSLAPFGLEKAIRAHIDRIREENPKLEIQLDLMPDGNQLSERARLALFRIFQHAVSNVIRHSNATGLQIHFALDTEDVYLEIKDNGDGFELPARWIQLARKGHLGLVGTAERAEALGGKLKIISSPGKGTSVQVTVPLSRAQEDTFSKSLSSLGIE